MNYDYIIVDSKLLAFSTFHRRQSILNTLSLVTRALKFNKIKYNDSTIVWALDVQKSHYRLGLWKDYKGHRVGLQQRSSRSEQERRKAFSDQYLKLPNILGDIGVLGIESVEADDMVSIIRELRPDAKILMISLDLDWLLNIDDNTHLLFFSTNTVYTNKEQVEAKIGINPDLYVTMSSISGQGKDNILNLKQFGIARFKKYLLDDKDELRTNYGDIIDELLESGKHGICVNPKAKFKDWRSNYHLNLQLMNSIPLTEVNIDELKQFDDTLDNKHTQLDYEDFVMKCFKVFNDIPMVDDKEFKNLRNE